MATHIYMVTAQATEAGRDKRSLFANREHLNANLSQGNNAEHLFLTLLSLPPSLLFDGICHSFASGNI